MTNRTGDKKMKRITLEEFKKIAKNGKWKHEQAYEKIDDHEQTVERVDRNGELTEVETKYIFGWAEVVSTFEDIKITYKEGYNYTANHPESFSSGTEGQSEIWSIEGVEVEDDEEILEENYLGQLLPEKFYEVDYEADELEDFDDTEDLTGGEKDKELKKIKIDYQKDIVFYGSEPKEVESDEAGGRSATLKIFKLDDEKGYVCQEIQKTMHVNEENSYRGKFCKGIDEVKEFFGNDDLAKDLYYAADM
jgi:hypothetical protein